jgi:citrate lyase beta subunit
VTTLETARSLLFAPADDQRKLAKALASDADGVVADLEDAVAPEAKPGARDIVRGLYAGTRGEGPLRLVRVNAVGTSFHADDLALVSELDLDAVVLPKATPEAVAALGPVGPPVVAIVETSQGVRLAHELAVAPRVAALQIGAVDLGAEVGLEPRADGLELVYVRSKLVFDAAAAGIRAPFDVVHLALDDPEALERECGLARSLGLRGKACIHPAQVPVANAAFSPTETEVAWARKVLAANEAAAGAGKGVFALEGTMIDLPVVERARRVLTETERRR